MSAIHELVTTRRVLCVVGPGGVGKTTTAAALGVCAAQAGRRVLVITIDPARRLASAMGLAELAQVAREVRVPDPSGAAVSRSASSERSHCAASTPVFWPTIHARRVTSSQGVCLADS